MNHQITVLSAGLYFVSTPIGAARDITLRALDIMASADVLAAEDTRTLRKLMEIHGVPVAGRSMVAYHDHSGEAVARRLEAEIAGGKSVAYFSEAGTPLISDPGYELGWIMADAGHNVTTAPGASAAVAALTVSGLPSDRFAFVGFLPSAQQARKTALSELKETAFTLIFYESPKRLSKMLSDVADTLGGAREAVVCRELTKKFEEISRGTVSELITAFEGRSVKGELVVVIGRAGNVETTDQEIDAALVKAMETLRVKDAATAVAGAFGLPRKTVYQRALDLKDE